MAKRRTRGLWPVHPPEDMSMTLPLFGDKSGSGSPMAYEGEDPNEPRDRVMQVYWSATNEMLVLGWAARRATNSEHRRALMELHELAVRRKDLARLLLAALWGIRFNPRQEPAPHTIELSA